MRGVGPLAMLLAAACAGTLSRPATPTASHELRAAEERVRAAPRDPAARRDLGWVAWMVGDRKGAERELQRAARLDGSDPRTVLGLAMLADDAGREAEAEALYLRLVDMGALEEGREALRRLGEDSQREHAASAQALARLAGGPLGDDVLAVLAAWSRDDRFSARRGCVGGWRAAGPLGHAPHVRLLAGPGGRPPPVATGARPLPAARCKTLVRSPGGKQGVFVLEGDLPASVRGPAQVELEVDGVDALARVWVGDRLVLRRDRARRFLPRTMRGTVTVRGGEKVVVELASLGEPLAFGVRLTPARGAPTAPPPASFVDHVLGDYLAVRAAMKDGDYDRAAAGVAALEARAARWPRTLEAKARLVLDRPARPRLQARDEARRILTRLLVIDPRAARLRIDLAELHRGDGDPQAALKVLGSVDHWRAWVMRARVHEEKGRDAEAEAALGRAEREAPRACPVLLAQNGRARERPRAFREASARALTACDPDSDALLRFAREAGERPLYLAESRRLASRSPSDGDRRAELARALAASGQATQARRELEDALALAPSSSHVRIALADLLAAGGDVARARALLEEGLRLQPDARSLAEARRILGGADPFAAFRLDGRAVIRAFEGEKTRFEAPAVLVLDRTVVRFQPDGTRATLTHNIIRVLQKEGLERWGEVNVPDGAEILLARTVKPDGTTREPESLAKEGLTAPDLAVGDYVEVEHVVTDRPNQAWAGGVMGDRFYFGTFEAPLDRTELVVVTPPALRLDWDVRGDAPAPIVTRDAEGDTVTTFAARHRAELVPEPVGPPYGEYVASAVPHARLDLTAWRGWLAEQTYGARRADGELLARARRLTAGMGDPEARARALHRFVTEAIDDAGGLSEEPSLILSRRRGRRAIVLLALAEAVGIPAELWFARPKTAGQGDPPPTQIDELAYPLVRLTLPRGAVFVDPRWRRAAFGWLPASVRGAPALAVPDPERHPEAYARPAALTRTPAPPNEVREVTLEVDLHADGSARVEAREVLSGEHAALWRDHAIDTPPEEIREELEQRSLGYYFPGSTLRSVDFQGLEDRDRPLVVEYRFDVPRYTRDGGVPLSPLPLQLGRRYILVGARTTPVDLADGTALRSTVRVHLPSAGPSVRRRDELAAPAGVGSFVQEVSLDGKSLVVKTEARLNAHARVPASEYDAFARFAASVDAAESRVVPLARGR